MSDLEYTIESDKPINDVSTTLERITPEHNFRILAVHNVTETLSEKGFEIEPLKIYEICNAGFAFKALSKDKNVAMFMPCKIVLRQEKSKTAITLVRPSMISKMLPNSGLDELAGDVEVKLKELIENIK
ncbi:MAG: DUF302 domain-containing protein [candidate division Zixibacteria bacterium]|nr:DUF302 domain-containing protein [candidate division Zixibacteria bacterium]